MKKWVVVLSLVFLVGAALAFAGAGAKATANPPVSERGGASEKAPKPRSDGPALDSEIQKVSYALGLEMGKKIKTQLSNLSPNAFALGFKDGFGGEQPALSAEVMQKAMTSFAQKMASRRAEEQKKAAGANLKEAQSFLEENAGKEGVVCLSSGLQYKVLEPGTGPKPTEDDKAQVHYRGTLLDGTEFDSSYRRGQPQTVPVNGVIPGWQEALQRMKVGAKWKLFVPPELAYGENGASAQIGPNELLIFEVELLGIK